MKKYILIVSVIILVMIFFRLVYSCISGFLRENSLKNRPAPNVVVQTVEEENIMQCFEAPGRVVSKYQVSIIARISGYLQKSYFKEGDFVKVGQTLFSIEPLEYKNALNSASANVDMVKAKLAYANKQLARSIELLDKDYISKARFDEILSNRDSLRAQYLAAKSSLDDSIRNLNYTQIRSPIEGRIGVIDVTIGNYVSPSSGPLTIINSMNPIYVTFPILSEDYTKLVSSDTVANCEHKVELYLQDGQKYKYIGVHDFVDNKVDVSTGTVRMRATFNNPNNELLHGQFVNVKLYANNKIKVPIVPIVAVQENQEGKYVYTIDLNNLPQLTYIKVQEQIGDNWVVKEGLKAGDKVITDGIQKVMPGLPVNIVQNLNNQTN